MLAAKTALKAQLEREIAALQGGSPNWQSNKLEVLPPAINNAFPHQKFQAGGVHEFVYESAEMAAATCGFIAAILASLMTKDGACIWISRELHVFPPALQQYGIKPEKIIFIQAEKEKELLWIMEEALKCDSLAAVVGEVKSFNFIASRRLQLAIEQTQVPGFVVRTDPTSLYNTACNSRWKISSSTSNLANKMPGVGFPRWKVELLKVRNGTPGSWTIEFAGGRLRQVFTGVYHGHLHEAQQKAG